VRPDIPEADWLPAGAQVWAREQRELLETIAEELLTTGSWPSVKALTRKLVREGRPVPVAEILWGMPKAFGFLDRSAGTVVLLLFGLRMTHAGQPLVEGFINALRLAVERYQGECEDPVISRGNLRRRLSDDEPYERALSEIVLREAPFIEGGSGGPADDWTRAVSESVVRYWAATTADAYLRIRAAEVANSPVSGWAIEARLDPVTAATTTASDPEDASTGASHDSLEPDVFISHASEDKVDVARPLAGALAARGWTCGSTNSN
jgi:hypothetical protein